MLLFCLFPQIAVSVNTQHFSSVSLKGGASMPTGTTLEPEGLGWNCFRCSVLGAVAGIYGSPSPPSPELGL